MTRQRLHFCICSHDTGWIFSFVELGLYAQSSSGSSVAYQVDDGLEWTQRLAAPIAGDVREQSVLNLIPLTRAGRKMADTNLQASVVGKFLQFVLPCTRSISIAATRISGDVQRLWFGISRLTHCAPPAPNGHNCEARRVVIATHIHPRFVETQVIDAVSDRLTHGVLRKVMNQSPFGCALGLPLVTAILEIADQLLFLRVYRYDRLSALQELIRHRIDEFKLRIAIWMRHPFTSLAHRLQTIDLVRPQRTSDYGIFLTSNASGLR